MNDVVRAAWTAAGAPHPPTDRTPLPDGVCARCNRPAVALTRVTAAISKLFTAFDDWASPTAPGLCAACAWAYRTPRLRHDIHLVTDTELTALAPAAAAALLAAGSLPPHAALVIPLRPGRKHLIAQATWGTVATDDTTLPWSAQDAARLVVLQRLRTQGFGSRMLIQPAPPWPALRRLHPDQYGPVLTSWKELAPWRSRLPWLNLALHVTTPTRPVKAAVA